MAKHLGGYEHLIVELEDLLTCLWFRHDDCCLKLVGVDLAVRYLLQRQSHNA